MTALSGARITALALVVPDYVAGLDFYVARLGFTLVEDMDQGRKRWITIAPPGGGPRLVLARADTPAQAAAIGNQTGGRVSFFLTTPDFARDHAALLQAGAVFEEPPRTEAYGRVAVWRDPFGNRWDLIGPAAAGQGNPAKGNPCPGVESG
jgi:catechol 2,3-dioxygenase-like lactoylglutathione lyase family enzyme